MGYFQKFVAFMVVVTMGSLLLQGTYGGPGQATKATNEEVDDRSFKWASPERILLPHEKKLMMEQAEQEISADIKKDLEGLQFLPPNKQLDDLLLSKGGQPVRHFVFSTWRAGSSFITEMIKTFPSTLFFSGPLFEMSQYTIRSKAKVAEGMAFLENALNCNFSLFTKNYIDRFYLSFFDHGHKVWDLCGKNKEFCMSKEYLEKLCSLHPIQLIKNFRLRLKTAKDLLSNPKLNAKVLFIVRDPRAVYISRFRIEHCMDHPDCGVSSTMCSDYLQDYYETRDLRAQYPDRFLVLRYEDVALNVEAEARKILNFFGLEYSSHIQNYLSEHTKYKPPNGIYSYSTYRDTKTAAFKWMDSYKEAWALLDSFQDTCSLAMKVWGYKHVSEKRLGKMTPIRNITFSHPAVISKTDL